MGSQWGGQVVSEGAGGIYSVLLGVFLLCYLLTNPYLDLLAYRSLGVSLTLSAGLSSFCWIKPMWVWGPAGTGSRDVLQSEKCFALTILDGSGSSEHQRATWTSVLTVWQKEWDVLMLIKALFSWSEAPGTQRVWQSRKSSCPGEYKFKQAIQVVPVWIFSLHSQVVKCFAHKQDWSTFPRNHIWSGLSCRQGLDVEDWI